MKKKKVVAVYKVIKTIHFNLTSFKKGERCWAMTSEYTDSISYYPENGGYAVFGEECIEALMPCLKKIKKLKYPMEYYQAQEEMKKIKKEINNYKH